MGLASGSMLNEQLRLVEQIGSGAMGHVWRAEDTALGRFVAVKLISALAPEERVIARFRREAALAAKIVSPHVVQIFSHAVSPDGVPYIVMELLAGRTLADCLANEAPLAVQRVSEILTQVARGLQAAHDLGIVHRDIKPANVFLVDVPGYDVFVKVLDFGIAKDAAATGGDLTATGAAVGTPFYMSPEQMTTVREVDHRADLWALGVMTYEMLTGEVPFRGETVGALAVAVTRGDFARASRRLAGGTTAFDPWFERALCVSRDERFPSADAMAKAFVASSSMSASGSADPKESPELASPIWAAPTEEFLAKQLGASELADTKSAVDEADRHPGPKLDDPSKSSAEGPPLALGVGATSQSTVGRSRGRTGLVIGATATAALAALIAWKWSQPPPANVGPIQPAAQVPATAQGSTVALPDEPRAPPPPRYRCHPDLQERGVVACGEGAYRWCDAEGRSIACCADGLVAAGHDGICVCPPLSNEAGRARGCKDAPAARTFAPDAVKERLTAAKRRVRACFHDESAGEKRAWRLKFLVDFSPEGETAAVKILRSDAPDPRMQSCALRELLEMEGWAARGGAAAWEMEWNVGDAPPPALAAARAAAGDTGYGYEFAVDPVTSTPPKSPALRVSDGRLLPEEIQRIMRKEFPKMLACYERASNVDARVAGSLILEFIIGQDGRVADLEVDGSDLPDSRIASCVMTTVESLEFPKSSAGIATVLYPLAFGPGGLD